MKIKRDVLKGEKNMKIGKILSVTTVMAMVFASVQCIFGTSVSAYAYTSLTQNIVTTADSNGVFWIEETAYSSFNSNTQEGSTGHSEAPVAVTANNSVWSGGSAYYDRFMGRYHDAEYIVNAASAGTYKLWYHGSDPTNGFTDKSKIYINGNLTSITKVANTDFNGTVSGSNTLPCAWFVGEVTLASGENTIRYLVDEKSTNSFDNGNFRYACVFDCVVLAPANYRWAPVNISSAPVYSDSIVQFAGSPLKIEETAWNNFDSNTNEAPASLSDSALSGGSGHYSYFSGRQHKETFKVENTASAGTYKLWYHGTDPGNNYYDKVKIYVNGSQLTLAQVANSSHSIANDGKNYACAWFTADVTLASGVNTILYSVTEKATEGDRYTCLLDCFVLAPASYEWTSPSINTLPNKVIDYSGTGAIKIEESDYNTFTTIDSEEGPASVASQNKPNDNLDKLSGRDAYFNYFTSRRHDATYKINVTEAGTYKLWYHGSDPTNGFFDKSKIYVNGTETAISNVAGTSESIKAADHNYACAWFVAEVTLTSGENTIRYLVNEKSTTMFDQYRYASLFDCFVLAPLGYEWASPSISTMPVAGEFTIMGFNLSGTPAANNTVSASATVLRNSGETGDVSLIIAVYDTDDRFVDYSISTQSLANAQQKSFSTSLSIGAGVTVGCVRAFLWEDVGNANRKICNFICLEQ